MGISKLLNFLSDAAAGASLTTHTVQEVTLDDVPPEAKKLANEAWHHLMHYATDEDIRSRDADYAKDQMELARWYEEKLRALFG